MVYQANVITVFIATPGDVLRERSIIREAISEWNAINSITRKIILQPLGWELDLYPDLAGRAQELVNNQVLKNADILVGVFWTRIGTPTGENESGTVEEIKEHLKLKKPAMIYFSDQPSNPSKINMDQYTKLENFKEWLKKDQGYIESYLTEVEFSKNFSRQLALLINKHDYFSNITEKTEEKVNPNSKSSSKIELSEDATMLLKELSLSSNGSMYKIYSLGGFYLNVNGKSLGSINGDPKQRAYIESAIEELLNQGLIIQTGTKGDSYQITRKGYEIAESK